MGKAVVVDLGPPHIWDTEYGLEITDIYYKSFIGIWELFRKGVGGLCCEEDQPVATQQLADIASDVVALPQNCAKGELPDVSTGSLACEFNGYPGRWTHITLRGVLSALIQDVSCEGTGELAVAVCSSLAAAGWLPSGARPSLMLRRITLKLADDDMLVEIEVDASPKCLLDLPIPLKDGALPLDSLRTIVENRG